MTSLAFSKKVALRYLWSKRSEAFVTIITLVSIFGVAIGVMVLTIVMSVMTGFEVTLREKIIGADSHIVIHKAGGRIDQWQSVEDKIKSVTGVSSVSPFTYHQVLLKTDNRSTGLLIRGIAKDTASADQVKQYLDKRSSMDGLFNPPPVIVVADDGQESSATLPGLIIGRELARNMFLYVGGAVSVLSPQVTSSPFGLIPKFRRFVVAGLYSSGLVEYESSVAYASLPDVQRFFGMGDAVTGLEVRVFDVDQAPQIAKQVLAALGGSSSGYTASDWTVSNKALWDAIKLEKKVYFIVLLLIIVMASFSIITTLIMLVLEKRKDIAIMKTMGASTKSIGRIFMIQGAVIGGVGTISGLLFGFLGCLALKKYGFPLDERIFQMSELPVHMEPLNFLLVGLCAFAIAFLATIYPARRASTLEPSDVLRYE